MVPYSEPSAFTKGFNSPYYKESHLIFKLAIRKFINEKVIIINFSNIYEFNFIAFVWF